MTVRAVIWLCTLAPLAGVAWADEPAESEAERIMRRVAWNQNRAQTEREAFRYNQSVLIRFHGASNKLLREEYSEFQVQPTPRGTEKERVYFLGKYRDSGQLFDYYQPHYERKDLDIDGQLISDLAEDLTSDKDSKDGIERDLFPLTMKQVQKYNFRIEGRESHKGREVYRITFVPKKDFLKEGGSIWAGEALIEAAKLQPVLITTHQHKGVPLWARTVFGTNITQLGFKVTYQEFEDDLWFPVSYGGEFRVKALFFYKRKISLSLRNSGFERADVSARITYGAAVE